MNLTCLDIQVGKKVQFRDALEALLQMGLHTQWILGLRENLQHLIVGQEEETRKN